jgi:hypothetical protein
MQDALAQAMASSSLDAILCRLSGERKYRVGQAHESDFNRAEHTSLPITLLSPVGLIRFNGQAACAPD